MFNNSLHAFFDAFLFFFFFSKAYHSSPNFGRLLSLRSSAYMVHYAGLYKEMPFGSVCLDVRAMKVVPLPFVANLLFVA